MSAADVTDGNSGEVARGGSEEDAVWLDLVGRFDAPAAPGDAPWPARENLTPPASSGTGNAEPSGSSAAAAAGTGDAEPSGSSTAPAAGTGDAEPSGSSTAPAAGTGNAEPSGSSAAWPAGNGTTAPAGPPASPPEEEEHYVPPPPPPLPRMSPVTKGAWAGLFGGPCYLLTATMAGWTIPSWLGFGAVAAFIGGFIVLVLHVGGDHDRGSGPDDGAVV